MDASEGEDVPDEGCSEIELVEWYRARLDHLASDPDCIRRRAMKMARSRYIKEAREIQSYTRYRGGMGPTEDQILAWFDWVTEKEKQALKHEKLKARRESKVKYGDKSPASGLTKFPIVLPSEEVLAARTITKLEQSIIHKMSANAFNPVGPRIVKREQQKAQARWRHVHNKRESEGITLYPEHPLPAEDVPWQELIQWYRKCLQVDVKDLAHIYKLAVHVARGR